MGCYSWSFPASSPRRSRHLFIIYGLSISSYRWNRPFAYYFTRNAFLFWAVELVSSLRTLQLTSLIAGQCSWMHVKSSTRGFVGVTSSARFVRGVESSSGGVFSAGLGSLLMGGYQYASHVFLDGLVWFGPGGHWVRVLLAKYSSLYFFSFSPRLFVLQPCNVRPLLHDVCRLGVLWFDWRASGFRSRPDGVVR